MLVNAMAPIRAEEDGPVWRQTTFYPFALTSQWARGASLIVRTDVATYDTATYGAVPLVDAVVTHDEEAGEYAVFVVNRSVDEATEVAIDVQAPEGVRLIEAITLSDDDPYAKNSAEQPERVTPHANDSARLDAGIVSVTLPAVSWTMLRLAVAS